MPPPCPFLSCSQKVDELGGLRREGDRGQQRRHLFQIVLPVSTLQQCIPLVRLLTAVGDCVVAPASAETVLAMGISRLRVCMRFHFGKYTARQCTSERGSHARSRRENMFSLALSVLFPLSLVRAPALCVVVFKSCARRGAAVSARQGVSDRGSFSCFHQTDCVNDYVVVLCPSFMTSPPMQLEPTVSPAVSAPKRRTCSPSWAWTQRSTSSTKWVSASQEQCRSTHVWRVAAS